MVRIELKAWNLELVNKRFTHPMTKREQNSWIRPEAIRAVLDGDQFWVTYMFTWEVTAQDVFHWAEYQDTLREGRVSRLPEDHKAFLRTLIRETPEDNGE